MPSERNINHSREVIKNVPVGYNTNLIRNTYIGINFVTSLTFATISRDFPTISLFDSIFDIYPRCSFFSGRKSYDTSPSRHFEFTSLQMIICFFLLVSYGNKCTEDSSCCSCSISLYIGNRSDLILFIVIQSCI